MRSTRYVEETVMRTRTVQQLHCDNCGTVTDIEALDRPDQWTTIFRSVEGNKRSWDFCEWDCVVGFVNAQPEAGPGTLLADLQASVEALS